MGRAEARRAQKRGSRRAPRARQKNKRSGIRRFFTWKKILGTVLGTILLGMAALIGLYLYVEPPNPNSEAKLQSNVYEWSDGTVMTRTGTVNRVMVPIEKVPEDVQFAFVALENKTFYQDNGVDVKGVARGLMNTALGRGKQGGSTITQQYVKNYYLTQDQTVTRKLKELVISLKVDQNTKKPQILAGYLNTSYFGRNAYGIQAAAQAYYGVDSDQLTLAQGAYLAALLQAPSQYDWAVAGPTSRELVMGRFNKALNNMVEIGKLSPEKRKAVKFQQPIPPKPAPGREGQKGYLVQAAEAELREQNISEAELNAGGWTIRLSVDKKRQAALEKAVNDELESKLDRKGRKTDAAVQAGATSVDPKTGRIVAMYGGTGMKQKWASNALRTDFQPGSTYKPVVLASALENDAETQDGKKITPRTIYDGTSGRPVVGSDTPFSPENQDQKDYGPITVQEATNRSVNSVYAQMTVDVTPKAAKKTALQLGMKDRPGWPDDRPATSLGTMSANTVEMAAVYATFDRHGKRVRPSIVESATAANRTYTPLKPIGDQAISSETADTVTKVLTGVVEDGSGQKVDSSAYEAAGKTGTTESNVAAWFTGYTPELVTVVAMFGEEPGTGKQVTLTGTAGGGRAGGSTFPAAIWRAYTLDALDGVDTGRFELPDADMGKPDPAEQPTASPSRSKSSEAVTPSPSRSRSASPSPSASRSSEAPEPSPSRSSAKPRPSRTATPSQSATADPEDPVGEGGQP
ncbi:transglycosylase domain-containing protein [Streptomyces bambusae]|uniref:transglycosylase domain-containing protein n=1 Tax=Streptomyces bambusae TaxID=1550616 RepID=UPI001CFF6D28|nr:transglycosylase domain-containing protein [Streptomyces bambusae]MCB5170461.1 transglycosylase domain-containing protein [Streptomyces bambusae]